MKWNWSMRLGLTVGLLALFGLPACCLVGPRQLSVPAIPQAISPDSVSLWLDESSEWSWERTTILARSDAGLVGFVKLGSGRWRHMAVDENKWLHLTNLLNKAHFFAMKPTARPGGLGGVAFGLMIREAAREHFVYRINPQNLESEKPFMEIIQAVLSMTESP